MRRIFINKSIIELSKDYVNKLFEGRRIKGLPTDFRLPLNNLRDFEIYLRANGYINFADYVLKIIEKYNIINYIRPQYFKLLHRRYFNNLTEADLQTKISYRGNNMEFYKHIVNEMRYDAVRDKEFLPYVKKLGIKTCIYCNTQFAITTENDNGVLAGKYELDHFLPKSKYPFLCISFFNLQPSCAHCNKSKNDREALFGLYTQDYKELSPFVFRVYPKSIVKYMLSQNCEDLDIAFDCIDPLLKNDHESKFHITELYSTQKDVIEEIIWKAKIYNDSYKKSLLESFSKLFPRTTNFNRLILGNYDQVNHCHKRPLSKLMQDIAKQLDLL